MLDTLRRPFVRRWGRNSDYYRLFDNMLGIIPDNIELYKLALIHKSASQYMDNGTAMNNERLEYLGDAVLETIVSDYLFITYPEQSEGYLTRMRSRIVSRQTLNALALELGLDRAVVANSNGMYVQKHIFGDALEALIGAIYLDKGYNFVNRLLINNLMRNHFNIEEVVAEEVDFKSRLIEWCQKSKHSIVFRTEHDKSYAAHSPVFRSTILIDDEEVGTGIGDSKKGAEQSAASTLWHVTSDEAGEHILDEFDKLVDKASNGEC